ncbi:MAG: lysophospholipase [marine benthic group bacterium]|jgi:alpha-beta hydrolase superfamily lysophospholipase|nr:lysophospholipase [Gemmatimonadota bacterium]MCL7961884.1 lysophospholipase [Candidatus Carthagonibacter metallireducens]MCL7937657.1 lysophospholipase [Gemmatimonadota bacterium]MCL7957510.1 lysophospholipase [Gemmatimonadota bacterium]MCL7967858.1 lysophospholipase [Gemmatimonadota bacterium]
MSESTVGYLEGTGGVRVAYRCWENQAPRGNVVCVHGLGEHSGRYQALAGAIAPVGLNLFAIDMRGHGLTRGRRGHIDRFDDLLRDLDRLRRKADGGVVGRPFFLVGHSLGGLVAGRYAEAFAPDGLRGIGLVAPFVDVAMDVPAWKRSLGSAADRLVPELTMDNGLDVNELFRREPDRSAYRDDPLVHRRISARLWGEMQRASNRLVEEAPRLRVPVLMQLAGKDTVVSNAASRVFASRLPSAPRIIEYDEAFHALFHDPLASEIFGDLRTWLAGLLDEPTGEPSRKQSPAARGAVRASPKEPTVEEK